MFTGIVQEIGKIASVIPGKIDIHAELVLKGLLLGESVAVNGACLTVTMITSSSFSINIMPETLQRSNLKLLKTGDRVNLESAMVLGGKLGGHLVQGHIDGVGKVIDIRQETGAVRVRIEAPREVMLYVVEKGFIAIDGVSLTVTARDSGSFWVSIVQYTWQHTILKDWRVGGSVNLEVDIIGKYIEQLIRARTQGVTEEFLREHGFGVA